MTTQNPPPPPPSGSGPWFVRHRPAGDWVVDQLDHQTMRTRRHGPYQTHAEAEAKWLDLTSPMKDEG